MEIDGVKIADDGTISFRDNERVGVDYLFGAQLSFFVPFATVPYTFQLTFASYLAGGKYSGDKCTLTVLRKGQVLDVETVLRVYPALSCELCCLLALTTDARQPTIPLVPRLHGFDSFASYFIVGGLVFCPLSGTQPVSCGVVWCGVVVSLGARRPSAFPAWLVRRQLAGQDPFVASLALFAWSSVPRTYANSQPSTRLTR